MSYAQINEASLKPLVLHSAQKKAWGSITLKRSEHGEQVAIIEWAKANTGKYPELEWLIAIPNGGLRSKATAMKLKAEGVKPGVSDLLLPVKHAAWSEHGPYMYCGLWLELKVGDNRPTKDQQAWLIAMFDQGYAADVAWGYDQAVYCLESYLKGEWIQCGREQLVIMKTKG